MKIGILTSPYYKSYIVNYPLKAFSKQLKNENMTCDILYFDSKKLFDFDVENHSETKWPSLQPQYLYKLTYAWNIGLNNYSRNVKSKFHNMHQFLSHRYSRVSPISPTGEKIVGVSYHVSYPADLPAVYFQRKMLYKLIDQCRDENGIELSIDKMLSPKEYKNEISTTAILPSPFGWGEVCARDYEAFISGAALLKPDMSMIETWPDYYIPNVTYVPFSWDFSDFKTKLSELLDNSEKRISIASQGQNNYMASISQEGGRNFAKRFKSLLTMALNTKR